MKTFFTTLLIVITTSLYSQNIEWETNLGGSDDDGAQSIIQTIDEGFIVAGYSRSSDGDVGGNNGDYDYWIVKLDINGTLEWETNLGGSDVDFAKSISQTTDGGYIIAGFSWSSNGDISGENNGGYDFWIVKLDTNGTLEWETNLGGSGFDAAKSISQTTNGGYIIAGYSSYPDGDVGGNNGDSDYWIVKLDVNGTLIWETNLGGSGHDTVYSITQTTDGGYIVSGDTYSSDGDVGGNNGNRDIWIIKLDTNGTLEWETNLGGSGQDIGKSIIQTIDGGFIIIGSSPSSDGDVGGNNGGFDFWIVKLDGTGNLVWETNLGGSSNDFGYSITQTLDGGYIVAGISISSDGDVGGNNGYDDFWIVKLGNPLGIEDTIASKIIINPNPATNIITITNLPQEITKIEVLDMQGRVVLSENNIINNTINISNLQAANYILKIHVGKSIFYKKVIKK